MPDFFAAEKISQSAEAWLYENTSQPEHIELGLERCKQVLANLNLSQPNYKIITVAGTNGKGSTVQFLDSMLRYDADEYLKVGRFTSPHLLRFNERIVINGEELDDRELINAFTTIKHAAGQINLTYFEYTTLAALLIFSNSKVDVAILEVGLGGRLDASNIVDADVAVITNIALDHQDWLGDDIELIAREKAGIMRQGRPVILAEANMPTALHEGARELGAQVYQLEKQYSISHTEKEFRWCAYEVDTRVEFTVKHDFALSSFQERNLSAAIAALYFGDYRDSLSQESIAYALKQGFPQGRLQTIHFNEQEWLLDVAHNPASMQVLIEYLEQQTDETRRMYTVVFSMLKDKDSKKCIELLSPFISQWYVAPVNSPRSLTKEDLSKLLANESVELFEDIEHACEKAKQTEMTKRILVCGSFYTVAAALKYLKQS